jgi:DNA-binding response OmpR family regulator
MSERHFEHKSESQEVLETKFQVVPLRDVPSPLASAASSDDRPMVLVVDDEPVIADTLVEILNRSGYAAIAAYDGEDALETALLMPPELVIADVGLPGISGIEVATVLRTKLPECKVLLLSGRAAPTGLSEPVKMDGNGFAVINKPIHPTELLAQISESLKSQKADQADRVL